MVHVFSNRNRRLLFLEGIFVNIGLPDQMLPQISPFDLVLNGCRLGGTLTGSKTQAIEMLVGVVITFSSAV
jgi:D-arabinose 1-dehydrogenase-like Zn-dependent alcohol dehydrogenase